MFRRKVTVAQHERAVSSLERRIERLDERNRDILNKYYRLLRHLGLREEHIEESTKLVSISGTDCEQGE